MLFNRLLTIFIIVFLVIIGYEAYYYFSIDSRFKIEDLRLQKTVSPTASTSTKKTEIDVKKIEEIKKVAEKRETLPTCLQKELNMPEKENWLVVCYNRMKKLFNVIDEKGELVGRYDGAKCQYYEKK